MKTVPLLVHFFKSSLLACVPIPLVVFLITSLDGKIGLAFSFALITFLILFLLTVIFGLPIYLISKKKKSVSYKPFLIIGILIPWVGMLIDAIFNSKVFWFEFSMYLIWGAVGASVSLLLWTKLFNK